MADPKTDLFTYLQIAREALLWKLEELDEYGARCPMTPTATNLLGLVKHAAYCEIGYFGATFGRPFPQPSIWDDDDAPDNADMWARPDESIDDVIALYRMACAHSDTTIDELPIDAIGRVAWWPDDRAEVTLHRVMAHMVAETQRHAGHADIVRELVDGAAGLRSSHSNMPGQDGSWWQGYYAQVEAAAREAAGMPAPQAGSGS